MGISSMTAVPRDDVDLDREFEIVTALEGLRSLLDPNVEAKARARRNLMAALAAPDCSRMAS